MNALRALADASRLQVARLLLEGPLNVGELQEVLGLGQSTVSHHLKVLLDAGLLDCRREGRLAWYGWQPVLAPAQALLCRFVQDHAAPLPVDARVRWQSVLQARGEQTRRFFDTLPGPVAGQERSPAAAVDVVGAILGRLAASRVVVDLGCGTGRLLGPLRSRAGLVLGVDQSPRMLAEAGRRVAAEGWPDVELRLGALEHLPLADAEADAAVAHQVLHHVAHPERVLLEAGRVLRPGGLLVVADYMPHGRESMRDDFADLWLGFDPAVVGLWLERAGLREVVVESHPGDEETLGMFVACARRPPAGSAPALRDGKRRGRATPAQPVRSTPKRLRRPAAQGDD